MEQIRLIISGTVQGVGFRYFIKSWAKDLGVTGWAKNSESGQVEAVLQGDKRTIKKLTDLCKKGPMLAEVKDIQIVDEAAKEKYGEFTII